MNNEIMDDAVTKKSVSPRLKIIEHFDSIVNDLEIYSEILLDQLERERGSLNVVYTPQYWWPDKKPKQKTPLHCSRNGEFSSEYEYERVDAVPRPLTLKEYVNEARTKAIEVLKKERDEKLTYFDENVSHLEREWSNMESGGDEERKECLREELFGKQICFGVEINLTKRIYKDTSSCAKKSITVKPIFKFLTIVIDFYLSEIEIVKLR